MQCSGMQGLYAQLAEEYLYIWCSCIEGIYAQFTGEYLYIHAYIYTYIYMHIYTYIYICLINGGTSAKEGSSAKFELISGLTLASQRSFLRKTNNVFF